MKKLLFVVAILAVSASSALANDNLLGELQALEQEYANLASQEEARFNEEKMQADAAREGLAQNERLYSDLSARAEKLNAEAGTRFYKKQYQELASKYEKALEKLNEEMSSQKAVISDFEKIQSLRGGSF